MINRKTVKKHPSEGCRIISNPLKRAIIEPLLTLSPVHLQLCAGRRTSCCGYRCLPLPQLWCRTRTLPEWVQPLIISGTFLLLSVSVRLPLSVLTCISFIKCCCNSLLRIYMCNPLSTLLPPHPPTPVYVCRTGPKGKGSLSAVWVFLFF